MSSVALRLLRESLGFVFGMDEEIWKDVVGYEGLYQVSNLGRVKSLNFQNTGKPKLRKIYVNMSLHGMIPYLQVDLAKKGERKGMKVHLLVCTAFHGPKPTEINGDARVEAMHLNGNSLDNRAENLAWGSHYENCKEKNYVIKQSESTKRRWSEGDFENQKKAVVQLTPAGEFVAEYDCAWSAQRETGCSQSDISKICRGLRKWLTKGYTWKFSSDYYGAKGLSK